MGHHFHSILGPGFDFEARIMETRPYIAIFSISCHTEEHVMLPSIWNLLEKYYPPLKRKGKNLSDKWQLRDRQVSIAYFCWLSWPNLYVRFNTLKLSSSGTFGSMTRNYKMYVVILIPMSWYWNKLSIDLIWFETWLTKKILYF